MKQGIICTSLGVLIFIGVLYFVGGLKVLIALGIIVGIWALITWGIMSIIDHS